MRIVYWTRCKRVEPFWRETNAVSNGVVVVYANTKLPRGANKKGGRLLDFPFWGLRNVMLRCLPNIRAAGLGWPLLYQELFEETTPFLQFLIHETIENAA